MEGTREDIFKEIDIWLNDFDAPNILWLSGSPGTGKSTIAFTLAADLRAQGCLGSSIFFQRDSTSLSDPTTLWRTVAMDLSRFNSAIGDSFSDAVIHISGSADIGRDFETLIKVPFEHTDAFPFMELPVIVVDALDECGSDISQSSKRALFLDTLTRWSSLPPMFKLIITGRDERVPDSFRQVCKQVVLESGDLASPQSHTSIRIFFKNCFGKIVKSHPFLPPAWPGESTIDELTARAAGVFIWAETVVRFMEQDNPETQLKLILDGHLGAVLDDLYLQIFEAYFADATESVFEAFRAVVGTIVTAKVPVHRDDLRHFIGRLTTEDDIQGILDKLSSVISIGQTDRLLRISHLSFFEFLHYSERCPKQFVIDPRIQNRNLALACLRMVNHGLDFHIRDFETSFHHNAIAHDPTARMRAAARLSYSYRFWSEHLRDSIILNLDHDIQLKEIEQLLCTQGSSWQEVSNLMKTIFMPREGEARVGMKKAVTHHGRLSLALMIFMVFTCYFLRF